MRPKAAALRADFGPTAVRDLILPVVFFQIVSVSARVLSIETTGADAGDCSTPCRSLDYAMRQLSPGWAYLNEHMYVCMYACMYVRL